MQTEDVVFEGPIIAVNRGGAIVLVEVRVECWSSIAAVAQLLYCAGRRACPNRAAWSTLPPRSWMRFTCAQT